MKIGNSRILAVVVSVSGAASLVLGLVAGVWSSVLVGAVCGLVGVLWLTNPLAIVTEDEIQLRNPLGMTLKRIPFSAKSDLSVRDGKLYVKGADKAVLGGFSAHRPDMDALARWIAQ